jgi:hypothetical protein
MMFSPSSIGGGFVPRCTFIKLSKEAAGRKEPFPVLAAGEVYHQLVHDLKLISQLEGEAVTSPLARCWYERWYLETFDQLRSRATMETEGFYGRYHALLEKLALLMCVCMSEHLVIEVAHFEKALELLGDVERRQHAVTDVLTGSTWNDLQAKVIDYVDGKGGFARWSDILTRFQRYLTARRLRDEVMTPLEQMNQLVYGKGPHPDAPERLTPGYWRPNAMPSAAQAPAPPAAPRPVGTSHLAP